VTDHRKNEIPLWKVLFWFSNRFRIEIVTWKHLPVYLDEVEAALSALTPDDLTLLGNPWNDEYVPNFSPAPRFEAELESNPDRAD